MNVFRIAGTLFLRYLPPVQNIAASTSKNLQLHLSVKTPHRLHMSAVSPSSFRYEVIPQKLHCSNHYHFPPLPCLPSLPLASQASKNLDFWGPDLGNRLLQAPTAEKICIIYGLIITNRWEIKEIQRIENFTWERIELRVRNSKPNIIGWRNACFALCFNSAFSRTFVLNREEATRRYTQYSENKRKKVSEQLTR